MQERLSAQGLRPVRKMVQAGFEAQTMQELKYEKLQSKDCLSRLNQVKNIFYAGVEAGRKDCLGI